MNEQQFMWYLLRVGIPLVISLAAVIKLITEPMRKIQSQLMSASLQLENILGQIGVHDSRISKHGLELDEINKEIVGCKIKIEGIESKINTLENKSCVALDKGSKE